MEDIAWTEMDDWCDSTIVNQARSVTKLKALLFMGQEPLELINKTHREESFFLQDVQDLCAARSEVFRKVRDTDLPRLMQVPLEANAGEAKEAPAFLQLRSDKSLESLHLAAMPMQEARKWCSFFLATKEEEVQDVAKAKHLQENATWASMNRTSQKEKLNAELDFGQTVEVSRRAQAARLQQLLAELRADQEILDREVAQAPVELREHVRQVGQEILQRHSLLATRMQKVYDARVGGAEEMALSLQSKRKELREIEEAQKASEQAAQSAQADYEAATAKVGRIRQACKEIQQR